MPVLNRVMLMGNLVRDVEVKHIASGMAVVELRLAMNDKFKDQRGQLVEKATFVDVVAWDRLAESVRSFRKGALLLIEGALQQDEWKSKDGELRTKLKIRASAVSEMEQDRDGARPSRTNGPRSEPSSKDAIVPGQSGNGGNTRPVTLAPVDSKQDDDEVPF